jgi:hypothetical protein
MIPFKFTDPITDRPAWDDTPEENRPSTKATSLHRKLRNAFEEADWEHDATLVLEREEKDYLFKALNARWRSVYRRDGWEFDFKPALNRYVIIRNHGGPNIVYAPDKTSVRKNVIGVTEIHEIPNPHAKKYREYNNHKPDQVALQPE